VESAADKKLIAFQDIPEDISMNLSVLSSPKLRVPILLSSATSPFQSFQQTPVLDQEKIMKLEESLNLYQQEMERMESQLHFLKNENEELLKNFHQITHQQQEIDFLQNQLQETRRKEEEAQEKYLEQVVRNQHLEEQLETTHEQLIRETKISNSKESEQISFFQRQYEETKKVCEETQEKLALLEDQLFENEKKTISEGKELENHVRTLNEHHQKTLERITEECEFLKLQLKSLSEENHNYKLELDRLHRIHSEEKTVSTHQNLKESPSSKAHQRLLKQLNDEIASLHSSKKKAVFMLTHQRKEFDSLVSKYLALNTVNEQLHSEKRKFLDKLLRLEELIEKQEQSSQKQKKTFQDYHSSLKKEFEEKLSDIQEKQNADLMNLQANYEKEINLLKKKAKKEMISLQQAHDKENQDLNDQLELLRANNEQSEHEQKAITTEQSTETNKESRYSLTTTKSEECQTEEAELMPELKRFPSSSSFSWKVSEEYPSPNRPFRLPEAAISPEEKKKRPNNNDEKGNDPKNDLSVLSTSFSPSHRYPEQLPPSTRSRESTTPLSLSLASRSPLVGNSMELSKLLQEFQKEESAFLSVRTELKELVAENQQLTRNREFLEENISLLQSQLIKSNEKILLLQKEYSKIKDNYLLLISKDERLAIDLQEKENLLNQLEDEKQRLVEENHSLQKKVHSLNNELQTVKKELQEEISQLQQKRSSQEQLQQVL
jgi:regulator of replication initiation timing